MKKILLLMLVTVIAFSSCKKYEDGPSISLRSAQSRLIGEWDVEKAYYNEKDVTDNLFTYTKSAKMLFKKDGGYEFTFDGVGVYEDAIWEFNSKKNKIIITFDHSSFGLYDLIKTYNITRLTNKELWIYEMKGSDKEEYKMKKKK